MVDIEMNNWWTATFPESPFVAGFLVSRQWADGRRLILSDWGELTLRGAHAGGDGQDRGGA